LAKPKTTSLFLKGGAHKKEQLHTKKELSEFRKEFHKNPVPTEAFL